MKNLFIKPFMVLMIALAFTACDDEMEQDYNRDYEVVSGEDSVSNEGVTVAMQQFIDEAASDGMMEVQLAQIVLEKGANQQVKELAQMIKNDHQEANNRLLEIARNNNLTLPDVLLPQHQQKVEHLSNLSSPQLSREYLNMMVEGHQKVIRKFKNAAGMALDNTAGEADDLPLPESMYSEEIDNIKNVDRMLKEWITNTIPVLEKHLELAKQLNSQIK